MKINFHLKEIIVTEFGSQRAFARALGVHESVVSHVVRRRWNLTNDEKISWGILLKCSKTILFGQEV